VDNISTHVKQYYSSPRTRDRAALVSHCVGPRPTMRSSSLEWPWKKRCVSCEQPQMVSVCRWVHASARRPAPSSETPRHQEMSTDSSVDAQCWARAWCKARRYCRFRFTGKLVGTHNGKHSATSQSRLHCPAVLACSLAFTVLSDSLRHTLRVRSESAGTLLSERTRSVPG
jgi:hypothetical protein